jgi:mono/diheme cytochrome c family protein
MTSPPESQSGQGATRAEVLPPPPPSSFVRRVLDRIEPVVTRPVFVYLAPLVVLLLVLLAGFVGKTPLFCREPTIGTFLPSEKAISTDKLAPVPPLSKEAAAAREAIWAFRYGATGTEGGAGIPYWIFRVMPRIFPERFPDGTYRSFGFQEDDHAFYERRQGDAEDGGFRIPAGLVVVDSEFFVPFFHVKLGLKRVAINCSGCHRGAYRGDDDQLHLVDGMPNHTADLQAFKQLFNRAALDDRFNGPRVLAEIDNVLREEKKPTLDAWERFVYQAITKVFKDAAANANLWEDNFGRPKNGPGRIDPFNAVKIGVIGVPDDKTSAALDFPAVWNQRRAIRPWHHYDGNTDDSSARNFGSILGVGGYAVTVNRSLVSELGRWLDEGLGPTPYPFKARDQGASAEAALKRGAQLYAARCASCHGTYDPATRSVAESKDSHYMTRIAAVKTDEQRYLAFNDDAAAALNNFGERRQLWRRTAFRPAIAGYLAGPLDGIWARAPYLHNGSVPTMFDLLTPEASRPAVFCRGNTRYDQAKLGFVSDLDPATGDCPPPFFRYDTTAKGNSNKGHAYTFDSPDERNALIAYLKGF